MSQTAAAALVDALRHPDPALPAKAIRSTAFDHPSDPSQVITSWKVAEHLYRSHTTLLPTLARGLFTTGEPGKEIIVGRGYDKFFNVDEVAYTSVRLPFPLSDLALLVELCRSLGVDLLVPDLPLSGTHWSSTRPALTRSRSSRTGA